MVPRSAPSTKNLQALASDQAATDAYVATLEDWQKQAYVDYLANNLAWVHESSGDDLTAVAVGCYSRLDSQYGLDITNNIVGPVGNMWQEIHWCTDGSVVTSLGCYADYSIYAPQTSVDVSPYCAQIAGGLYLTFTQLQTGMNWTFGIGNFNTTQRTTITHIGYGDGSRTVTCYPNGCNY